MKPYKFPLFILASLIILSCNSGKPDVPVIGFVDAFEDETLSKARSGFVDALKKEGFSEEDKTLKIIFKNAYGDIPALTQIVNYYISEQVDLIAACPTLSTITAVQNTSTIPVFMMVSPTSAQMKVNTGGKAPVNLFGVHEELAYIDTSFLLIPALVKPKAARLKIGMIYNQAEPQSVDAVGRISELARKNQIDLIVLPLNASSESQIVTQALLSKGIDAFFANPDNTVFASFETILKNCNSAGVPIFSSEAGLVQRGAVAAFGADLYQWGYQSGLQAAKFLKSGSTAGLAPEMVKVRNRVYNKTSAGKFLIAIPEEYTEMR